MGDEGRVVGRWGLGLGRLVLFWFIVCFSMGVYFEFEIIVVGGVFYGERLGEVKEEVEGI